MGISPVIVGDSRSVLRLGPAKLKNQADWSQDNSDTIAHFIQVVGQIQTSTWASSKVGFKTKGDELISSDFPSWESFVYATIYFRQLYSVKDKLFKDACKLYYEFVDSPAKASWIQCEQKAFDSVLDMKDAVFIPNRKGREIFEAFLYGALLVHSVSAVAKKHREVFKEIVETHKREHILFGLNGILKDLQNSASAVARVWYQEFADWLSKGLIPKPDLWWHNTLVQTKTPPDTTA